MKPETSDTGKFRLQDRVMSGIRNFLLGKRRHQGKFQLSRCTLPATPLAPNAAEMAKRPSASNFERVGAEIPDSGHDPFNAFGHDPFNAFRHTTCYDSKMVGCNARTRSTPRLRGLGRACTVDRELRQSEPAPQQRDEVYSFHGYLGFVDSMRRLNMVAWGSRCPRASKLRQNRQGSDKARFPASAVNPSYQGRQGVKLFTWSRNFLWNFGLAAPAAASEPLIQLASGTRCNAVGARPK